MAMIVDAIVGKLLERMTGIVEEKAIMMLGVKVELQKLQRTVKRIGLLLKDAEKKSIEDESIKGWIAELKDFMYDAEDIIDRCMHEGTKILQDEQAHDHSSASQTLLECTSCPCLPSLGQLPHLKYLKIHGATSVVSIGAEFLGSGVKQGSRKLPTAFPKLEELYLWSMQNWEEWSLGGEDNEVESNKLLIFPCLQRLGLLNCPKLKALPRGLSHAHIQRLYINNVHSMETIEDIPTLSEKLDLQTNQHLSRVSNLPTVKLLFVYDCPKLECVEKLDSLQSLELCDLKSNSLPEWLVNFLQEKHQTFDDQFHLHMEITVEALKGCLRGSPAWSVLEQVPRVTAYAEVDNESKYLYYTNETSSYETNLHEE